MPKPFILRRYKTGERTPLTGIYKVTHKDHRLQHQVTIIGDEQFPRCAKCANDVFFELVRPAPTILESDVIRIYKLPEVEGE